MDFLRVALQAPRASFDALARFYGSRLGLEVLRQDAEGLALRVGAARLELTAAGGEPFYHVALLVPGDRFDAARQWAAGAAELLPGGDIDEVVFDFPGWNALACYFHDPAGNIVELIAHRGIAEAGATGAFDARELAGISEVGLVGDRRALAEALARLDLPVWSGTVDEPGRLAFVGEQARTLILSPPGRGWLPTGRSAEPHPVEAVVTGPPYGEVTAGNHRIVRSAV